MLAGLPHPVTQRGKNQQEVFFVTTTGASISNYRRETLRQAPEADKVAKLRLATHRGRPLATGESLSKLQHRLGRRVRSRPVGRPKLDKSAKQARTNSAGSDRRNR